MVVDRNLWKARADQAWGASDVWNSGTSWESAYATSQAALAAMTTDRNTWQANAGQAYSNGVWGSGSLWSALAGQAYTGGVWGSGSLWSAVATGKTTSTVSTTSFTSRTGMTNIATWLEVGSLTAPRTGHCLIHGMQRIGFSVSGAALARIKINGAVVATSPLQSSASGDGNIHVSVYYNGPINSGDTVTLEIAANGSGGANNSAGAGGAFLCTVGSV
jgi:hypothetical protein